METKNSILSNIMELVFTILCWIYVIMTVYSIDNRSIPELSEMELTRFIVFSFIIILYVLIDKSYVTISSHTFSDFDGIILILDLVLVIGIIAILAGLYFPVLFSPI